jgi:hypothetical protein
MYLRSETFAGFTEFAPLKSVDATRFCFPTNCSFRDIYRVSKIAQQFTARPFNKSSFQLLSTTLRVSSRVRYLSLVLWIVCKWVFCEERARIQTLVLQFTFSGKISHTDKEQENTVCFVVPAAKYSLLVLHVQWTTTLRASQVTMSALFFLRIFSGFYSLSRRQQ